MDIVYASDGGRTMHKANDCPAVERARLIWDSDEHAAAPSYLLRELSIDAAFDQGKRPCAICCPTLRGVKYRGNGESDFGHEPEPNRHVGPVCSRCRTIVTHYDEAYQPSRWVKPVPWPCTSAIVLGLTPRNGEAA